jgi:hypothetical protein
VAAGCTLRQGCGEPLRPATAEARRRAGGRHAEGNLVGEEAEERVGLRQEMERLPLHRRYSVPFRSHRTATLVACAADGLIQFCVSSRPRAELEKKCKFCYPVLNLSCVFFMEQAGRTP